MTLFEVAVVAPIHNTLTYGAPTTDEVVYPGQRILVPLGSRLVTGYCLGCAAEPAKKMRIRAIHSTLDPWPIFPSNLIKLFRWAASYYQHPIGEIIKTALPAGLAPKSAQILRITEAGKTSLSSPDIILQHPWLRTLLDKGHFTVAQTKKTLLGLDKKIIKKWHKQGFLATENNLSKDIVRTKTETCLRLNNTFNTDSTNEQYSKPELRTLALLNTLGKKTKSEWIAKSDLTKQYSGARKAIIHLTNLGAITLSEREVYRDPFGERPPFFPKPANLTPEQIEVLAKIAPDIIQGKFRPFLLHGITGSGKTEVYLRAAETALSCHRTVLVLVPEIALATQIEGHFVSRFGDTIALLHSGLSSPEKYDQWQRIRQGKAKIVIGARSALFAPLEDPGLIIVDEEHDGAYKQDSGFRYNGRDMAVLRAKNNNAVVILGSATPSVNSYHNACHGKYTLLEMRKRVEGRQLPEIEIIDLRAVPTTSGQTPIFSPQLTQALRANLQAGDQSLVFLNRRGYANLMVCRECGESITCPHCNITLTLHHHKQEIVCHYCGFNQAKPSKCPHCHSENLVGLGFGTERIEDELNTLFPNKKIARLDQDTTTKRGDLIKILKDVSQKKIDILVGTQMIAKGHHFPHVTLVGVVWADAGLGIPDFRSSERTYQLLTQVFGRAGRGEKPGRVIVQTHNPEHYTISTSQEHDYIGMYNKEVALRRQLSYPPFSRLVNLLIDGEKETDVKRTAAFIAQTVKKVSHNKIGILGPAPAPISKLRGRFRWQVLLKTGSLKITREVCQTLHNMDIPGVTKSSVKLSVDVDPENML